MTKEEVVGNFYKYNPKPKTSQIAKDAANKIKELQELLLNVENVDEDYIRDLNFCTKHLRYTVFSHIVKYEYGDLYLKYKNKKSKRNLSKEEKRTISNLEKTFQLIR